jgi:hypothetical protein
MVKIYLDTSYGELRNFRRALAEKREFQSVSGFAGQRQPVILRRRPRIHAGEKRGYQGAVPVHP